MFAKSNFVFENSKNNKRQRFDVVGEFFNYFSTVRIRNYIIIIIIKYEHFS